MEEQHNCVQCNDKSTPPEPSLVSGYLLSARDRGRQSVCSSREVEGCSVSFNSQQPRMKIYSCFKDRERCKVTDQRSLNQVLSCFCHSNEKWKYGKILIHSFMVKTNSLEVEKAGDYYWRTAVLTFRGLRWGLSSGIFLSWWSGTFCMEATHGEGDDAFRVSVEKQEVNSSFCG